jgi:hypothetical protein
VNPFQIPAVGDIEPVMTEADREAAVDRVVKACCGSYTMHTALTVASGLGLKLLKIGYPRIQRALNDARAAQEAAERAAKSFPTGLDAN